MSSVPGGSGVAVLVVSLVSVLTTLGVLTAWAKVRYARRLQLFRCRLGPPARRWGRRRARWRLRRTRAAWVGDVLVLRSGTLRLWLDPYSVGVSGDVMVVALPPGEVRGLGPRPVALRFTRRGSADMEIAVAGEDLDRLVGPFLTAAPSGLPGARKRGG